MDVWNNSKYKRYTGGDKLHAGYKAIRLSGTFGYIFTMPIHDIIKCSLKTRDPKEWRSYLQEM